MDELREFIESGILEMYVLGETSPDESALVERMVEEHPEIKAELYSVEVLMEDYAMSHATIPDPTIKPFLMATVDYMDRIQNGEEPSYPPQLRADSKIEDYDQWLKRPDLQLTAPLVEIEARIIGHIPNMITAIVWIKNGSPPETHKEELESFLIVEGTCNIVVEGNENHLKPGDIFTIPLHMSHTVIVTSDVFCKIILQRLAA